MRFSPTPSRLFDHFGDGFGTQDAAAPEPRASRPILLAVDDDEADLRRISRELHKRYGEDYRVVCQRSTEAALGRLQARLRRQHRRLSRQRRRSRRGQVHDGQRFGPGRGKYAIRPGEVCGPEQEEERKCAGQNQTRSSCGPSIAVHGKAPSVKIAGGAGS